MGSRGGVGGTATGKSPKTLLLLSLALWDIRVTATCPWSCWDNLRQPHRLPSAPHPSMRFDPWPGAPAAMLPLEILHADVTSKAALPHRTETMGSSALPPGHMGPSSVSNVGRATEKLNLRFCLIDLNFSEHTSGQLDQTMQV